MNKKKTVVLSLLLVVIVALTSCLLYACDPANTPEEPEKLEATEGLLIQNGDFKLVDEDATSYPRSMNNWSGSKMYSSSSFRDDVIAGAISLDSALYAANKQAWDDADETLRAKLTTGGHGDDKDENKNVLMIYQPTESKDENDKAQHGPTAYGYTSASFTLSKGSYYKLSVDVLTYDIKGTLDDNGDQVKTAEPGARIYVSSNTYAEFAAIDTKGEWKTYEIYIETSPTSSTSLTVQLGLGKYTASYSDGLTSGYAFFDNLSLKKLVKEADSEDTKDDDVANLKVKDPQTSYANAVEAEEKNGGKLTVAGKEVIASTTTLKVPNGRFDFGSYNLSSSGVPNSWTHVTGNSGKDDAAPTGLGYNAIIDTRKFADNYRKYSPSYKTKRNANANEETYYPADVLETLGALKDYTGGVGTNVFLLSQQLMTAQGIRSSRSITIEKGKTYALKISLLAAQIRGAGVSLILSGSDGKDIVIEGIAQHKLDGAYIGGYKLDDTTNGYTVSEENQGETTGWIDYTFYIKGNDFKDYSYNLAIWLGTEGTSSNTSVNYRNLSQNSNSTTYLANGTFSTGWVFIDELTLTEGVSLPAEGKTVKKVDADNKLKVNELQKADIAETNSVGAIVDLSEQNKNQLENYLEGSGKSSFTTQDVVTTVGTNGAPKDWTSNYDLTDSSNPRIEGFVREGVVDISDEKTFTQELGAYPGLPYANMPNPNAYAMYASQDSYYEVESAPIIIKANKFYRVSFWLKTVDVKDTSGAYVYVLNKTAQAENKEKNGKDDEVILTSITRINTDDYDEYLNDWVEINLIFRGAVKKDTEIALKLTLGTGDRYATTTLTSGAVYVTNFNMADLTYANYTGTSTSTYTKTCDLSTSYTYQFTNGSFDNYDLDDENLDSLEENYLYNQKVPAMPGSWDISDETVEKNKTDKNLYAGIIQLKEDSKDDKPENFFFSSSTQAETATGLPAAFFNNFYGNKESADYYNELNMKSIAGPNVLAIGSKSNEKFAIGFTSTSFTLSANTYNVLSLYAKTYGPTKASIRLTGEASGSGNNGGSNNFLIESSSAEGTGWTKYVFFIKVGKNSVSLKLNLWLGEDVKYIADEDDDNYDTAVENAKSAGHVFFDNISSYTLEDEDKYDEALKQEKDNNSEVKELDFQIDSFDPLSGSVDSRRSLTSPSGWSGAAGTNQSSANTKSGIIFTGSDSYYETEALDGTPYVKLLGKDYDSDDITVSEAEKNEYLEKHPELGDTEDYQVREQIIQEKIKDLKMSNWIPVEQLTGDRGAHSGDHMLVINNTTKSAYTYTSSSNTLNNNSVYKISVFMRTYGLNNSKNDEDFDDIEVTDAEVAEAKKDNQYASMSDDDIKTALRRKKNEIGAYIELYLGSANETGNEFAFKAVISSEWTEYCFYVQTQDDDVTSVTLKLSLGRYTNKDVDGKSVTYGLTTGYAMFDDISITEITENGDEEFTNVQNKLDPENSAYDEEFAKTNLARKVASSESGSPTESETNTETPKSSFNLDYLWWMIPTIVLGLVIIIVLVVFVVRKIRKATPNRPAKIKKAPVPTATAQALDEKHDRYDQDKD